MRSALLTRPVFRTSPFDDVFRSIWSDVDVRTPHLTSSWDDEGWTLNVDLPGVPDDTIDVSVTGRNLQLSVKTDELSWDRTVQLRSSLDPERVEARYVHGRLTVHVGTTEQPEARSIAIDTTPAPEAIETSTGSDEQHPSES